MKINNQIKSNQKISNHLENQMKEIEKGCRKKLGVRQRRVRDRVDCCIYQLCPECKLKLKLLKQFQKEIKEVQEDLEDKEKLIKLIGELK